MMKIGSNIRLFPQYGPLRALVNAAFVIMALAFASPAQASGPIKVLMIGDSLTAGYGLAREHAIPERLESLLRTSGFDVRITNAGVSGDTSAGGRARLGWALADKPHLVIIELGANDGLRGLDPGATRDNLDAMIRQAKASGARVLLTGMLAPPNLGPEYGDEFNAVYPNLAKKHNVALFPFFLKDVAAEPALNQDDGIHPNPEGAELIAKNLLGTVKRLLDTP